MVGRRSTSPLCRAPRLPWVSLLRRRAVPQVVRDVVLPEGDRRVGWALTASGEPLVAGAGCLVLPDGRPVAWRDVERAIWKRPVLTVVEIAAGPAPVTGTGRTTTVELAGDDGDLPALVHSAVTGSIAWSTHARLEPGGGVRVVGRRRPGWDSLDWQAVFDPGTDVHDPRVRAQAEALVERSRRAIG